MGANRDQRHLFQVWILLVSVGLSIARSNLLNVHPRGSDCGEVLAVDFFKQRHVRQIIEIDRSENNLIEFHLRLFQIVQLIPHRLVRLMGRRRGIDAGIGSGNESALRGTIERIARKHTGTRGWTRRHILRANRVTLAQVTHCNARVGDVRAIGQARHLNRRAAGSISEFEAAGILLVHNARGNVMS